MTYRAGAAIGTSQLTWFDRSGTQLETVGEGIYDLYVKISTGAAPEEVLLADQQSKYPFSWSPDGEHLLYATVGPNQDLWTLSLSDRKSRPFMQTSYDEYAGRFSPNGRWIAYRSNESERPEVYVTRSPIP